MSWITKFVVVVVAAILVAMLVVRPAFPSKEHGYNATMKADLLNLIMVQESFRLDSARYARSIEELGTNRYRTSANVTITISQVGDSAWTGTARHSRSDATCELSLSPPASEPVCVPDYVYRRWVFVWNR